MSFLTIALVIAFGFYLFTVVFLASGIRRNRSPKGETELSVTVVVAVRNEERIIESCLQALVRQTYPVALTEIIIVDDRSSDNSGEIIKKYTEKYQHVHAVAIHSAEAVASPKKRALSLGIEKAQGEIILTTDADCLPPLDWISTMVKSFDEQTGLVVGLALWTNNKSLLGRLLSLDSLANAIVSAGTLGWNIGITCTGRNMAYRKKTYSEVGGFERIKHSLSGDDDLFLQSVSRYTGWKSRFTLDSKAIVPSPAVETISDHIKQRTRHISAGKYYSPLSKLYFLLLNMANLSLFVFPVIALMGYVKLWPSIFVFVIKLFLDYYLFFTLAKKTTLVTDIHILPVWEFWYVINQITVGPLGLLLKARWK